MLLLRKDMLMPEGVQDSLVQFMDDARDPARDSNHSKQRYTIIQECNEKMHYYDGYLCYVPSGEMRYRTNTISYSREIHLYAWDKVIALIPSNKRSKELWLHPKMEDMIDTLNFSHYYYGRLYKARIQECLKISQQT